jgi:hypothetical protein
MSLSVQIRELVDGLSDLMAQHIRLAKVELKDDARFIGIRVGVIAALAPLILVGYGFLCAAAAMALSRVMATDLALLLVGGVNLLGGIAGIAIAGQQLGKRKVMEASMAELEATRALVPARAPDETKGAA